LCGSLRERSKSETAEYEDFDQFIHRAYLLQTAFLMYAGLSNPMTPNKLTANPMRVMTIRPLTLAVRVKLNSAITNPRNVVRSPIATTVYLLS
jgi:hypothetical protein